jgi:tRNA (adenine57-N1/adenine58-N1)-methyltransferase
MRALGGKGHLFSFEYNKERAEAAQKEFKELRADNVSIFNRDAYKDGFLVEGRCDAGQADSVFLDLPSPWLAIDHAKEVLRKGGR